MALTISGKSTGMAAQLDQADVRNEMWARTLNPTEAECAAMDHEMDEAKEQKINEAICQTLAPVEFERISEFKQIRKAYRSALRRLVEKLEAEERSETRERNDLYSMGMGA